MVIVLSVPFQKDHIGLKVVSMKKDLGTVRIFFLSPIVKVLKYFGCIALITFQSPFRLMAQMGLPLPGVKLKGVNCNFVKIEFSHWLISTFGALFEVPQVHQRKQHDMKSSLGSIFFPN